ncbi:Methyltransferase domain protein [Caballeronia arvi]|uniref:Methyltransferase domain protein n=1 Tax=Caballeronia arvi TaxID=1777135 RepID=A0A158KB72_9BURK|nr:FkbM family methyltransferase [Caballeronia arvi]SAL78382.1 Methyltransferase domain protein [Caballeronia arvi]
MQDLIKQFVKDVIPPRLFRLLKPSNEPTDAWGGARWGMHGLVLPGNRRFEYRPCVADRGVCKQIFFLRSYATDSLWRAKEIAAFYDACENPLIIDAGANIGASAVWYALTYPKAKIVAIEPDVANFALLKRNAAPFPLITPLNAAIAAKHGTLYLNDPGGGEWAFRTAEQPVDKGYAVDALTLEELIPSGVTPFILKIDIEGAESDLFSRHCEALNTFPLIVIELHDWMLPGESNSRNFLQWHVEMKRDFVQMGENAISISNSIALS